LAEKLEDQFNYSSEMEEEAEADIEYEGAAELEDDLNDDDALN